MNIEPLVWFDHRFINVESVCQMLELLADKAKEIGHCFKVISSWARELKRTGLIR